MERVLEEILPIMDVEHDAILSKSGDVTVAFRCELPEIFTLSNEEYEAFHQAWIKALKVLPKHSIFHKQDWFSDKKYKADLMGIDESFLSRSSERFFNERPFLDHTCYLFLTKKPAGRKISSSLFSNLLRKSIVPSETLHPQAVQDFFDCAGQFQKILEDSGFVTLRRLTNEQLRSTKNSAGVIEQYMRLSSSPMMCDIRFKEGIEVGDKHMQLFTMSAADDLPALCGSRINYDKYSTIKPSFLLALHPRLGNCCLAITSSINMCSSRMRG
ncbi:MAG TPA: DUF3875 domain-containing protein [Flavisolibacter sp.]|nr:DUF3875 domain-containing protein [Flavisolibacter sp.]